MSAPALHIVRPNGGVSSSVAPVKVKVELPLLLQLLESVYTVADDSRIIGTLLGTRSDDGSIIEVHDAYVVPHKEEGEELIISDYHHKLLYQLHKRANPKEVIVGWFAINSQIDSFTGLIHSFYSNVDGMRPHAAVHMTVDTIDKETGKIITPVVRTFIGSIVGAPIRMASILNLDRSGSFIFTPIENEVVLDDSEQVVLKLIENNDKVTLPTGSSNQLKQLNSEISDIEKLIDQISGYVDKVISGEIKGDDSIGKFLLENLIKKPNSLTGEKLQELFNNHIQDTLMVEYLASSIKSQLELSAKLTNIIQE